MPNTAEGDFDNAVKNYEPWKLLRSVGVGITLGITLSPHDLRQAYEIAWNAGYYAGEIAGRNVPNA